MNTLQTTFFGILSIFLLSSFNMSEECTYASTNLNYVKSRTEEAMTSSDINKSRFYTYKAIKVIHNSQKRFDKCGCTDAGVNIEEGLINLKAATKSTSLNGTRILLKEALAQIGDAIDNLDQHKQQHSTNSEEMVELSDETISKSTAIFTTEDELHRKIDLSLLNYSKSINDVVESVECHKAYAYAKAVFERCEKTLLIDNLSEGKKYYNLRTKQITEEAILRIGDCEAK